VIMPIVTADWVAASGVSPDAAAPAVPTPTPTTVADKVAVVMAATPSRLRPTALAFVLPRLRSPDRPIAPDVSTVPSLRIRGRKCARSAAASPPGAATIEDTVYRFRPSTYCNIRRKGWQDRLTFSGSECRPASIAAPLLVRAREASAPPPRPARRRRGSCRDSGSRSVDWPGGQPCACRRWRLRHGRDGRVRNPERDTICRFRQPRERGVRRQDRRLDKVVVSFILRSSRI
jgi:hypothetical protein